MDFSHVPMSPVDYDSAPPSGLHATHSGSATVADLTFRVYQLSDGRRVIDSRDVEAFLSPLLEGSPAVASAREAA